MLITLQFRYNSSQSGTLCLLRVGFWFNGVTMSKANYFVDREDSSSVETLIDTFEARGTAFESAVRSVLGLLDRGFMLRLDFVSRPQLSPLDDAFAFDPLTQELVMFSDDSAALLDGLLEILMYARGFQPVTGSFDEWKAQFTSGAWRHVRKNVKEHLDLPLPARWQCPIDFEAVERYNVHAFETILYLAGRPEVEAAFPEGADAEAVRSYRRLYRIFQMMSYQIGIQDAETFNRRHARAQAWVEQSILPGETSLFDDLIGPGGFNDRFFSEGLDD